MKVEWPKSIWEWFIFSALIIGACKMYLYERPTSFQMLVILLLMMIFSELKQRKVTKHTHHIEIEIEKDSRRCRGREENDA